eukprot:m.177962 g.177962  ORF g.177962 m.177962 type:complete len:181 (-) comp17973_c3_seq7:95-637(-)
MLSYYVSSALSVAFRQPLLVECATVYFPLYLATSLTRRLVFCVCVKDERLPRLSRPACMVVAYQTSTEREIDSDAYQGGDDLPGSAWLDKSELTLFLRDLAYCCTAAEHLGLGHPRAGDTVVGYDSFQHFVAEDHLEMTEEEARVEFDLLSEHEDKAPFGLACHWFAGQRRQPDELTATF